MCTVQVRSFVNEDRVQNPTRGNIVNGVPTKGVSRIVCPGKCCHFKWKRERNSAHRVWRMDRVGWVSRNVIA